MTIDCDTPVSSIISKSDVAPIISKLKDEVDSYAYFITEICPYNDNPSRISNYFWAAGVLYTIWLEQ